LAKSGIGVVVVTHDQRLVPYASRVVEVQNGAAKEVSQSDYLNNLSHP
jgi:ABC-type lipoprotein export system ATPase subunit